MKVAGFWRVGQSVPRTEKSPRPVAWGDGSPGWTRTNNPPVNSRMLCQLSYRGTLLCWLDRSLPTRNTLTHR
jgi:hypothetical protein